MAVEIIFDLFSVIKLNNLAHTHMKNNANFMQHMKYFN